MAQLRLAWRMLGREWRSGDLRILALALAVAVTSVTSVGFFTDRVRQGLSQQANQLLAADLAVIADHPIAAGWASEARRRGLKTAQIELFPSMAQHAGRSQLAEIKAVSAAYPLRGELRVAGRNGAIVSAASIPPPGSAWVEQALLDRLGLALGGPVTVGDATLTVAGVLLNEPDRGGGLFALAPRLLMNLADLPRTGLVQPGSRIAYRLLVAGREGSVESFRAWAEPRLQPGERLEGLRDARPEIRSALQRAQQFLGLAALVSAVLAAVAVSLAARRFMQRHLDSCALLRCLGASQGQIFRLYLFQFMALGLTASLAGCAAGFLAQYGLVAWLGGFLTADLPWPTWHPAVHGFVVGMALLLGFSLPYLMRLRDVSALRVLRREWGDTRLSGAGAYALGVLTLALLLLSQAGDVKLGIYVLAGLGGALVAASAVAFALIRALSGVRGQAGGALRLGLAALGRRSGSSIWQITAFAIGLMALLLLTLVRGDLLREWQQTLPPDAPNRFVINIQPDQRRALQQFFAQRHLASPALYPMVRGRLLAINGRDVSAANYPDARAQRLVEREFNLSWAERMQTDNRLVAGRWWTSDETGQPFLSVEEGIAKTLGIRLGDRLTYGVAGETFTATVSSLRKVAWDSFRANFFVIGTPGLMRAFPASYMTSLYIAPEDEGRVSELVRDFPNLSVIDVAAIMEQVHRIMDKVAGAVEFVFLFTLLAGGMVLYAALASTQDERRQEAAVLRVLGASRRQLMAAQCAEFAAIGLSAGVVAALMASALGYALATRVLNLSYSVSPWLWLAGIAGGGLGVTLAGLWGTRRIADSPPLQTLREL
ncbi:MAG: FtsX-like permease family protein [Sulfuricellaceae bacterium]|nr:FtsX-like permease family protein [Sulfuricellaceae bacterium]